MQVEVGNSHNSNPNGLQVEQPVENENCCANCWERAKSLIPVVSPCLAFTLLIMNCLLAGSGTIVFCCINKEMWKENLIIGILQFVLMFVFIGWLWSVIWGVFVVLRRKTPEEMEMEAANEPSPVVNPQQV